MNILIIGAFGFVGTYLSMYLYGLGHSLETPDIGLHLGRECSKGYHLKDLIKFDINHVDAIIHSAGKAHDT